MKDYIGKNKGLAGFFKHLDAEELEAHRKDTFNVYASATGVNGKICLGVNYIGKYEVRHHKAAVRAAYYSSDIALIKFKEALTVKYDVSDELKNQQQ